MDYKNLEISTFEDSNKTAMLISLLVEGTTAKTALYNRTKRGNNNHGKLDDLEEKGLVKFDHRPFENNTTFVELTEKGRIVAQKLLDIQNMLSGESECPECPPINHGTLEKNRHKVS